MNSSPDSEVSVRKRENKSASVFPVSRNQKKSVLVESGSELNLTGNPTCYAVDENRDGSRSRFDDSEDEIGDAGITGDRKVCICIEDLCNSRSGAEKEELFNLKPIVSSPAKVRARERART